MGYLQTGPFLDHLAVIINYYENHHGHQNQWWLSKSSKSMLVLKIIKINDGHQNHENQLTTQAHGSCAARSWESQQLPCEKRFYHHHHHGHQHHHHQHHHHHHHHFHFHSTTILIHPHELDSLDQMLRVAPPERRPLPGQSQVVMIMFDIDHHYIDKLFSCVSIVPDLTRW